MPMITTGYIKTTGFGVKIRKSLFAARKTSFPHIPNEKVAQVVGELNQKVFEKLQQLSVGRDDVLKIQFDYKIEGDNLIIDYNTLSIQVFKPIQERIQKIFDSPEEKRIIEKIITDLRKYTEEMVKISREMSQLLNEIKEVYELQTSKS
ncbi:MAG: DUF2258 domain-containing protein [Candidatus Aenigmarchaeota archaeon]|nr:DUF2258 domain-containing protein [Candidatus Aenigmarchaeota archaeon]MDW8149295.1 DUF2258 domain-containing protein [Candidatus Aenigmarchaeota archaeon]